MNDAARISILVPSHSIRNASVADFQKKSDEIWSGRMTKAATAFVKTPHATEFE